MRHQKTGRKLSRTSAHREAMFANMVSSLLLHERIETTSAKAKELRRFADRAISWGMSVGELTAKARDQLTVVEKASIVHAMRQARRHLKNEEAVEKLFHEVAPRFQGRHGGYTRILKTRVRAGDAAPMSLVELTERAGAGPAPEPAPTKGGKTKVAAAASKGDTPAAKAQSAAKATSSKTTKSTKKA